MVVDEQGAVEGGGVEGVEAVNRAGAVRAHQGQQGVFAQAQYGVVAIEELLKSFAEAVHGVVKRAVLSGLDQQ